jgi:predicted AlkP superfamily pyrophosphatase or phosphodiesterase
VAIVLDQVPSWALDKYRDALAEDGAIRRGLRDGASYVASFPYSTTFTGPGHATLFSGATPSVSGITGNQFYDRSTRTLRPTVSDSRYPVLGNPKATASPIRLRVPTVGDALKRATNGAARVAALSLKDRAAVLPGGQRPDVALWYDAAIPGFTTSTYYSEGLPEWLVEWQRAHPTAGYLKPWSPLDPETAARFAGADDAPGEGGWAGLGASFPHDPTRSASAASVLRATPAGTDYLLDLARAVIDQLELGEDDVPDLLTVSVSGTDYVGHVFGPDSWEYFDNLVRVDRALGAFTEDIARRPPL